MARGSLRAAIWALSMALAAPLAHAQADAATAAAALRQEQQRLADTDTLLALTSDGAALYARDAVKLDGYQYCSQAVALAEAGEFRLGVRAASKALHLAGATQDGNLRAMALRDLAIVYSYAGQLDQAVEFAQAALALPVRDAAVVHGPAYKVLGDVAQRRGNGDEAVRRYEEALAHSSARYAPLVRASLAQALIQSGGQARLARAQELLAQMDTPAAPALAAQLERTRAELLLAQQRPAEAKALYQALAARAQGADSGYYRLWAWEGVARSEQVLGDTRGAARAMAQALDGIDQVRARFRSDEFKMGLFSDVQALFDRAIALYADLDEPQQALAVSERSRSRALLDAVRGRAPLDAQATMVQSLPALQAALRPDERVVQFHALPTRLLVWVVGPHSLRMHGIAVTRTQLDEAVESVRNAVVAGDPAALPLADRVGAALLAPLGLEAGQRLIVVPHGPLHYLPFQALRLGGRYVVQDHALSVAPSMSIAVQLAQRPGHAPPVLAAFGNPRIEERFNLPGAEAEVRQIARLFPRPGLFMGEQATKAQFRQAAPRASVLHVAAHAVADPVDPLYSRILLANEGGQSSFLEAHEVMELPLHGNALVTLSTCDSGLGRVAQGDEVLGFTRSFLAAGSGSLVASLWPVSDAATALLMQALYGELAQGRDAQQAMQAAQLAVMRDPRFAHPFFWGGFNLIGDWRLRLAPSTAQGE